MNKLRQTKNPNPYPHKFHVSQSVPSFVKHWGEEGKIEIGATADSVIPVSSSDASIRRLMAVWSGLSCWPSYDYTIVQFQNAFLRSKSGWSEGSNHGSDSVSLQRTGLARAANSRCQER